MADKRHDPDGISRREFGTRIGVAAGLAAGGGLLSGGLQAAPYVGGRVLGANDRVVTASIGIRGQGNALKRGFARLKNVEIKTLCDIDANLAPERINDERLKDVATFKPGFGTRSPPSGRCRRASTSTSRSPRLTPCGRGARWSRRRRATTRSCKSAR